MSLISQLYLLLSINRRFIGGALSVTMAMGVIGMVGYFPRAVDIALQVYFMIPF